MVDSQEQDAIAANRAMWDDRVEAHWKSAMYRRDAEALRGGGHCLRGEVVEAVGDVAGKSLIHLQCHMGMETLSWARLGADVTGLDFSRPALDKAEMLRDELGLDASFVCGNLYDAPKLVGCHRDCDNPPPSQGGAGGGSRPGHSSTLNPALDKPSVPPLSRPLPAGERGSDAPRTFDIVFQSLGSLCWLPDREGWARVVAGLLNTGGHYVLNDGHPFADVLEQVPGAGAGHLEPVRPYFHERGIEFDAGGTYADPDARFNCNRSIEFIHPLGGVVTSLIEAGLVIDRLVESPWCGFPRYGSMEQTGPDMWELPGELRGKLPMSYLLAAHKG